MRNGKEKVIQEVKYRCRDCANSYDWHDKAHDGHLMLCRCRYDEKTDFGKWCKFLSDPACDKHFKLRTTEN